MPFAAGDSKHPSASHGERLAANAARTKERDRRWHRDKALSNTNGTRDTTGGEIVDPEALRGRGATTARPKGSTSLAASGCVTSLPLHERLFIRRSFYNSTIVVDKIVSFSKLTQKFIFIPRRTIVGDEFWDQFWTASRKAALHAHIFDLGFRKFDAVLRVLLSDNMTLIDDNAFRETAVQFVEAKAKELYASEFVCYTTQWSVGDDEKLKTYILENGLDNWSHDPFPDALPISAVRMRARYEDVILPTTNALRWTEDEDVAIVSHVRSHGLLAWNYMDMDIPFNEDVSNLDLFLRYVLHLNTTAGKEPTSDCIVCILI